MNKNALRGSCYEFLSEGQRVPPAEKKTTLVKMLAKLIVTLPRPSV